MATIKSRLEKLERRGRGAWQSKLREFARALCWDEGAFLQVVKGHERELAEQVEEGGRITWPGLQLLYSLWVPTRPSLAGAAALPAEARRAKPSAAGTDEAEAGLHSHCRIPPRRAVGKEKKR